MRFTEVWPIREICCRHPEGSEGGNGSVKQDTSQQHYKNHRAKPKQLHKIRPESLSQSGPSRVQPTWPSSLASLLTLLHFPNVFLCPCSSLKPQPNTNPPPSPTPAAWGTFLSTGHTGLALWVFWSVSTHPNLSELSALFPEVWHAVSSWQELGELEKLERMNGRKQTTC